MGREVSIMGREVSIMGILLYQGVPRAKHPERNEECFVRKIL